MSMVRCKLFYVFKVMFKDFSYSNICHIFNVFNLINSFTES